MQKDVLRKIQKIELYVLKEVKRICEKNDIKYFLIAGTLIGCIRHQGFIPWDDDIDVGMLRIDFNKFIEACKKDLNPDEFFLQIPENEENSADYGIARLRLNNTRIVLESRKNVKCHEGFFVEIFPYDNMPDNKLMAKIYGNGFAVLKRIYALRKGYTSNPRTLYAKIAVRTATLLLKPVKTATLQKWLVNYPKKYADKKTVQASLLNEGYAHEHHDYKTLTELTTGIFENETFPIPSDYDKFLTEQYGNYMQLPPLELQVNHHKIIDIDFGKYEEFIK